MAEQQQQQELNELVERKHQQQQNPPKKRSEESVKLFVGQIPKHINELQLLSLFQDFALVDEVNIIKDKSTKLSRGCCFLICPSREEADKIVFGCHNKKTIPGASSPLQVKYADGELERLEHKLFVGMLPKNVLEAEVSDLFSKYGVIKELQLLRGSQQTSKGCAFLKYETKEQALAAMEAVNGKHTMEGSNVPLVVKWADTEKERQARMFQKSQLHANDPSQNSIFGALPLGYVPPYNGFGYQGPRGYGLMPYRLPPMQTQPPYQNMVPQGNGLRGARPDLSSGVARRSYVGPGYPAVPNVRFPLTYPGGMTNQRPLTISPGSLPSTVPNSPGGTSPGPSPTQIEGPPGANLFIYHIPQEYSDSELANVFKPFGRVLSARVFVDKVTGLSKCFGFVSYNSPVDAQTAINMMNGYQLGDKKLKVQLKRDNKQNKTY